MIAFMSASLLLSLTALVALVPVALVAGPSTPAAPADWRYWAMLGVAVAGPALWVTVEVTPQWRTGIAAALWLIVATTMALFALLAIASPAVRRLTTLLVAYLLVLGVVATVWQHAPERPLPAGSPAAWLQAHIFLSLAAFGLLTLAAVAGAGVFIKERAIRAKRLGTLAQRLPAVADGEVLQVRLLIASEGALALALATGASMEWLERRALLRLDHKTVLSLAAFALIAALLLLHRGAGISGRRAARFVLVAYLLITLAYPGVKFITDVLMG